MSDLVLSDKEIERLEHILFPKTQKASTIPFANGIEPFITITVTGFHKLDEAMKFAKIQIEKARGGITGITIRDASGSIIAQGMNPSELHWDG